MVMANPIMRWLGFDSAQNLANGDLLGTPTRGIHSSAIPGGNPAHLAPFVWSDIFDIEVGPVTRAEAMQVPAIAKARATLHSVIARRPLRVYRDGVALAKEDQPTWLYRSDHGVSPYFRNCSIIDDLLFSDASLLAVDRGTKGQIIDAVHVPRETWRVNDSGQIVVSDGEGNESIPDASEVVLIPGNSPGLLVTGAGVIRGARTMERAWVGRVKNPTPTILLVQKEQGTLDDDEVKAYTDAVRAARQDPDGTVAFIPAEIGVEFPGGGEVDLFNTGRNNVRIDIANLTGFPVSILDGSVNASTLTYSTSEGKRNEFFDYTVGYWTNPIEESLSLDNVTPRGTYIRFDFSEFLSSTTPTEPQEVQD